MDSTNYIMDLCGIELKIWLHPSLKYFNTQPTNTIPIKIIKLAKGRQSY